ncbi:unnamed protein product [Rotaria sp. Silwood1]|nr:unnamed protein product [Rotaria sp. Silwood1]CAF4689420.1 unnamed protein product [Rotaria sp. Silwood1]
MNTTSDDKIKKKIFDKMQSQPLDYLMNQNKWIILLIGLILIITYYQIFSIGFPMIKHIHSKHDYFKEHFKIEREEQNKFKQQLIQLKQDAEYNMNTTDTVCRQCWNDIYHLDFHYLLSHVVENYKPIKRSYDDTLLPLQNLLILIYYINTMAITGIFKQPTRLFFLSSLLAIINLGIYGELFISNIPNVYYTLIIGCLGAPRKPTESCGYNACNLGQPDKLNVHIVPHTHDDVGWLKTVDQYFYGARNDIQHAAVQHILDSVTAALLEDPDRRFIYVEIAFFWRWWMQQTEDTKNTVRKLVNEGRLEFISGGWSMNDEGATHYNSIIDQHSLGAEFLRDQFGECGRPKLGWQIDPFGHARETASLFAQMGFDGLFFGRVDFQDYDERNRTKTMEMIWKGSANLGEQSWLFSGILPRVYSPPSSFCFDYHCRDEPIKDDPKLSDYNVPERVQAFIDAAHIQARSYTTNHIMMTMGSDFHYENAHEWYKNLDKLIKHVNAEQVNSSDVNLFYSTPTCYLYALNQANRTWTTKTDDFFPISYTQHGLWTGFFTSRPALKRYERYSNNILQVTRQLNAFSNTTLRQTFFPLNEAMGVAQHHDAVSGTEKQHVANDYAQRLSQGIDSAIYVINEAYKKLLLKENQLLTVPNQFLCQFSNISECLPIEGQNSFTLTIWNPIIHSIENMIRVPVTKDYSIHGPTGEIIVAELLPISEPMKNIPGRTSSAQYELLFRASLPALGFNTYYFQAKSRKKKSTIRITHNEACILQNQYLRAEFDDQGNLNTITNKDKEFTVLFTAQGLYWYTSFPGNNSRPEFQASGAYFFRPLTPNTTPVSNTRNITCTYTNQVQKALIVYNDWASQEIKIYNDTRIVEIEWIVGPIPIDDNIGKEIIMRYDTDIQSNGYFYTDANGREVLERKRDYRPSWNYTVYESVSGNYYPVPSRIWIKDNQRQMTILTDRSEGGSSMHDGSVELMVHRRTLYDDSQGVGEPMNETAYGKGLVICGKHFLIVEPPESSAVYHRPTAQHIYMHPISTYALPELSYANYANSFRQTWSALIESMPYNVHLLTLDQLTSKIFLIRVEHYFELNEDDTFSKPVQIDLQNLFNSLGKIIDILELTLGANLPLNDMKRLVWRTINNESSHSKLTGIEKNKN